jgi:hypothetical protein
MHATVNVHNQARDYGTMRFWVRLCLTMCIPFALGIVTIAPPYQTIFPIGLLLLMQDGNPVSLWSLLCLIAVESLTVAAYWRRSRLARIAVSGLVLATSMVSFVLVLMIAGNDGTRWRITLASSAPFLGCWGFRTLELFEEIKLR